MDYQFFKPEELRCKCGCGMMPQDSFIAKVERLRAYLGFPFVVTSCARCPSYNKKVAKTGASGPHTYGRAMDIAVARKQAYKLLGCAELFDMTGIGIDQKGGGRFIHIDDLENSAEHPRPTVWSY